jgi:hypothetical protein
MPGFGEQRDTQVRSIFVLKNFVLSLWPDNFHSDFANPSSMEADNHLAPKVAVFEL